MSEDKRYKKLNEAFQYIDDEFLDRVEEEKRNRKQPVWSIIVKAAACICLLIVLPACAIANKWFGLKELLLHEKEATISLSGYMEGAEAQALAEWEEFLSNYDTDQKILSEIGNGIFIAKGREEWSLYGVYSYEMGEKLDEIAGKYGLKLHTKEKSITQEELESYVGGSFLKEGCGISWGYIYEDGTFRAEGEAELDGYGTIDFQFGRVVKGIFDGVTLNIGDVDAYTEWQYQTASGETVLLALGSYRALIFADFEECFIAVNGLSGSDEGMTKGSLQELADKIEFKILKDVRELDIDTDANINEIEGYLYGTDGQSIPVKVLLSVENVVRGEAARQALAANSMVLPQPREGEEYIVVTLNVTYVDGGAETLYLAENKASLVSANLLFTLQNGDSNAVNITAYLDDSIHNCELRKGESAIGRAAFIHNEKENGSLKFYGFGNVVELDIEMEEIGNK